MIMNEVDIVGRSAPACQPTLLERARGILGIIADEAPRSEAQGRLTEATVSALEGAGLFRLLAPKCYGGFEAGAVEALEVLELLCQTDGSAGWVAMACNVVTATTATFLPDSSADAMFGKHFSLVAGQGAPRGKAIVEGDGYRVTGKWSYGSGVLHSDYLHTGARVYDKGEPREAITCIVPVKQATLLGNWDVIGLRATGSVDYSLENVFVPREFTHSPDTLIPLRGNNLFRIGIVGMSPLAHGSFALGVARHILDELVALATASDGRPAPLVNGAEGENFQDNYGAAEAKLRAGRAFLYDVYHDAEATLKKGDPISVRQISLMRMALVHVTAMAAEVCTFAYHSGGGVALRNTTLQRCFRDMMAGAQHRITSPYMLRECTREVLGMAKGKIWTSYGLVDPPAGWPY
jgi:alkylation response protein AidB-like acyl-CoA dehydrogenase